MTFLKKLLIGNEAVAWGLRAERAAVQRLQQNVEDEGERVGYIGQGQADAVHRDLCR